MGMQFDGNDDLIWLAGTDEVFPNNGAITISFWVYSNKNDQVIMGFGNAVPVVAPWDRAFAIDNDNKIRWKVWSGATFVAVSTTNILCTPIGGTWYHIVGTIDIVNGNSIWVNGINEDTHAGGTNGYNGYATPYFVIGNEGTTDWPNPLNITNGYFNGKISEVAIWNVTLTTAEISLLANSKIKGMPLQIRPSNLQMYLPLHDVADGISGDGITFMDMSASGRTGTGDDGGNNTGLIGRAEEVLSYW